MKKILFLLLFLPLLSCSYLTEFFIYNNTNAVIKIEYQALRPSDYDPFTINPKVVRYSSFKKTKDIKDQPRIKIDTTTLTVQTTIQPKQALWIGADSNFSLNSEHDREKLRSNLKYLKVRTHSLVFQADSTNVLNHFQTFDIGHVGIVLE